MLSPSSFTISSSKAIFLLQFHFVLFVLFSLVCCSVMLFHVILTLFCALGEMCSMIMAFTRYPRIYILFFNPFMLSELFYHNSLDRSISYIRGV